MGYWEEKNMSRKVLPHTAIVAALVLALGLFAPSAAQAQSDEEIRQMMIDQSIRSYSGNCPCPYNRASNGSRCGGRSAYSRPGGASPLCYPSDISAQMVENFRQRHGLTRN